MENFIKKEFCKIVKEEGRKLKKDLKKIKKEVTEVNKMEEEIRRKKTALRYIAEENLSRSEFLSQVFPEKISEKTIRELRKIKASY